MQSGRRKSNPDQCNKEKSASEKMGEMPACDEHWLKDVGIKLDPVDGDECIRGLVPQECQGQSEQQKPRRRIR